MSAVRMPKPYFQPVSQLHSYNNMAPVSGSYPVISARRKTEQVDWRKIAALNIDQMTQAFDFNMLQENIYSITFCDIESEVDMRLVDPNYVKLFKLSQLTIEYLLNSQDYLTHQLGTLEENMKQYQHNIDDAKTQYNKLQKDMSKVAKESHKRKKLLMAQQQLIHGVPGNYHKCSYCPKAFLHESYLQKHISKRHADIVEPTSAPVVDADISSGHGSGSRSSIPVTANVISALETQVKDLKEDLTIFKEREQQKAAEMQILKKLLEERDNQYEADLVDIRRKLIKQSNIGSIHDDDEEEENDDDNIRTIGFEENVESRKKQVGKKQKSKVSEPMLEKKVEKKVQNLEKHFNTQMKRREKKWLTVIENMKTKYEQEMLLLQQKQKEAIVMPSNMLAKSVKRKLHYSQKPNKINEPKIAPPLKENKKPEVSSLSYVMPMKKSQDDDEDDDDEEEDDDDDEMDDVETEEEEEDEKKEDEVTEIISADQTLGNTLSTTGSLTERMQHVYKQVTQNSKIQQEMRIEMANLLSEKLEKIGLPQSTKGISKTILSDKLSTMKKERLSKAKRFPNFEQQRQHLEKLAENTAKKKLEAEYLDKEYVPISQKVENPEMKENIVKVVKKQPLKSNGKKSSVLTKPPSPIASKKQPKLQTSTSSLKPQPSLTSLASKPQWPQELWKPDSEDENKANSDSWSEDDNDEEGFVDMPRESTAIFPKSSPPARPPPPLKQSILNRSTKSAQDLLTKSTTLAEQSLKQHQPQATTPSSPVKKTMPPVPFPRSKSNTKLFDISDDDDSDNWDNFNAIQTAPAQTFSNAYSNYKPKRDPNVARLGSIIEDKLTNRPSVQFAGAVDLLNKNDTPKADDSDFSKVSSLEDDFLDNKVLNPRFSSTPASKGQHNTETDASSNTYSTSFWGSSSKAMSSISAGGSMASNKQLTPSESEWDSD